MDILGTYLSWKQVLFINYYETPYKSINLYYYAETLYHSIYEMLVTNLYYSEPPPSY